MTMKTPVFGCVLACALGARAWAADATPPIDQVTLDLRLRHEHVEQSGLRDADALTFRARLGIVSDAWHGWQAGLEAEHVSSPWGDRYSQAGLNAGGAGRAVVSDPEGTELNQAYARYTAGETRLTLGRQRLVLDQARFVGDVGWRQNAQTFDAVVLTGRPRQDVTLTAAYIGRVNRILGDRHPQGNWDSESYLANARWSGLPGGATATAYVYLLDFANAPIQASATYGLSLAGSSRLASGTTFAYRAEYARQTDYGASPLDYAADYAAVEAGPTFRQGGFALGGELLGADRGGAFRTPLATLHAFNGWADVFTTTPAQGLRDFYLRANANLPAGLRFTVRHHRFEADRGGARYGREWNAQLTRAFGPALTVLLKGARFEPDAPALPRVTKVWLQVEYTR